MRRFGLGLTGRTRTPQLSIFILSGDGQGFDYAIQRA
jgi:hypothetical protein